MPRAKTNADLIDTLLQPDDKKAAKPEHAPRASKKVFKPSAAQVRSIREGIQSVLVLGSLGAGMLAPTKWTAEDQFSPEEVEKLGDAVYAELALYPGVLHWLTQIDRLGPHVTLLFAVATVAAPRLARRNIIPPLAAMALAGAGDFVQQTAAAAEDALDSIQQPTASTAPVAARRSSRSRRTNEVGQEHAGEPAAEVPPVPDRVSEQDGPGAGAAALPSAEDSSEGFGLGLDAVLASGVEAAL